VPLTHPVDGFRLSYRRAGAGPPVVLLHGWPGDHHDWDLVFELLHEIADVVAVDLRGFGGSEKHCQPPTQAYSRAAQAASVIGLIEELGLVRPVVAGYDIGSRIAQEIAQVAPVLIRGIVIAPPVPGAGQRILAATAQREFWYQAFHSLELAETMIDGKPDAVRAYLRHFWTHWSGPEFTLREDVFDRLVAAYAEPGAFAASIGWYRAGSAAVAASLSEKPPLPEARIAVPATILWPAHDPLFPLGWSDRIEEFFSDAHLHVVDAGHFMPVEAPDVFAQAIRTHLS